MKHLGKQNRDEATSESGSRYEIVVQPNLGTHLRRKKNIFWLLHLIRIAFAVAFCSHPGVRRLKVLTG